MNETHVFSTASRSAVRNRTSFSILAALWLWAGSSVVLAAAPADAPMTVVRVVAGRVDIAVPGAQRLALGDHLSVARDGVAVAEIVVTILGNHSASCRIEKMGGAIAGGDLVRALIPRSSAAAAKGKPGAKPAPAPAAAAKVPPRTAAAGQPAPEPEPVNVHYTGSTMTVLRTLVRSVDISLLAEQPIQVGERLSVERGGLVIGEIEVVLLGQHSASCRIDRELRPITEGDVVRKFNTATPATPPALPPAAAAVAPPAPPQAAPAAQPSAVPPAAAPAPPTSAPPAGTPPAAPPVVAPPPALESAPPTAPPAAEAEAVPSGPIHVRQVMTEEIFLDAGRAAGLAIGQKLKVMHGDTEVGELEIAFLANHSASCKIVSSTATMEVGDVAIPGPVPAGAAPAGGTAAAAGGSAISGAGATAPGGHPPGWVAAEHTDYSGSIALRYQGFRDGSPAGRDFNQESALFNIYLGHIAGSKFDFRFRGTAAGEQVYVPNRPTDTRNNNRLYEATLTYEPPNARFTYQIGRLISGPLVGFDYLDGGVGEFHATRRFSLGTFVGSRSNGDQLTLASPGHAYGLFAHWLDQTIGSPFYAEYLIEAIGDYVGSLANREYLSFYGRQGSGSRWSLYERAEFDLGHSWKDSTVNQGSQLSNVLFSGSYSFSKSVRLGVSYDQSRQILTLDDRFTPEQLFDNSLREGARVTAYLGSAQSVRGNLSVGERWKKGSPDRALAYNANVYYSNLFHWNLLVGGDYSGFNGDTSKGFRAGLRMQKYFSSGHDLELTFGTSTTEIVATRELHKNQWMRLSGTLQLGRRFYLLGEYEKATGDDLQGDRLFLQLGYRL